MAYRDVVLADNPVAYWRLNETTRTTAIDATGRGHTGTYSATGADPVQPGPLTAQEPADTSVYFNGAGLITVPAAGDLNTGAGAFSLEAWVLQAAGVIGPIVEYGDAANWGIHLWVYPTPNDLMVNFAGVGAVSQPITATGCMGGTWVWHHCVAVYAGGGGATALYCDGKLVGTGTVTTATLQTSYGVDIGHRPMGAGTFITGRIDEVAIYNTALSAARVQAHFAAGAPYRAAVLADAPLGYWQLNDQQGTVASDASGFNRHGTLTGGMAQAGNAVARDTGVGGLFNGTSSYVAVPATGLTLGTGPGTIEAWARLDAGFAGNPRIVAFGANLSWEMFLSGSRSLCVFLFNGGVFDTGIVLALGVTYHLVASISAQGGGNITIFVNGVQRISVPNSGGTNSNAGQALQIGQSGNSADWWKGLIDEVALYPTALSATRVDAHYRAGRAQPQRWDGAQWVPFAPQRWDGAQWVPLTPRRWDATAGAWV